MNKVAWWSSLAAAAALLVMMPSVPAQEHERRLAERLERLEQQVQRLTAMQERSMERLNRPVEAPRPPLPPPSCPMSASCMRHLAGALRFLMLLAIIINIILAVWVYSDVRKRAEGRGIFIVLVLLAGIPAAILYALIRIGDRMSEKTS